MHLPVGWYLVHVSRAPILIRITSLNQITFIILMSENRSNSVKDFNCFLCKIIMIMNALVCLPTYASSMLLLFQFPIPFVRFIRISFLSWEFNHCFLFYNKCCFLLHPGCFCQFVVGVRVFRLIAYKTFFLSQRKLYRKNLYV